MPELQQSRLDGRAGMSGALDPPRYGRVERFTESRVAEWHDLAPQPNCTTEALRGAPTSCTKQALEEQREPRPPGLPRVSVAPRPKSGLAGPVAEHPVEGSSE